MQDRAGQNVAVSDPVIVAVGSSLWPGLVWELRPDAGHIIVRLLEFDTELVTANQHSVLKIHNRLVNSALWERGKYVSPTNPS